MGEVVGLKKSQTNLQITVLTSYVSELQVDQSVSHNGVCLTVTEILDNGYSVDAIEETLSKTTLGELKVGMMVNTERCIKMNGRIDGHFVQGHVDTTATLLSIDDRDGSWIFRFSFSPDFEHLIVDKGSICINGVSLTVVDPFNAKFSVAIIPYTYKHTNFCHLSVGDKVNIEFDILGKYIARHKSLKSE